MPDYGISTPRIDVKLRPGATPAEFAAVIAWLEKQRGVGNG